MIRAIVLFNECDALAACPLGFLGSTEGFEFLYDEKISGSLHFTPGDPCEDLADNGNRSAVHWDLVLIQTPEWGGGEIWLDGALVRKDGLFALPELEGLNPENLMAGETR